MTNRNREIANFLSLVGWGAAERVNLAGDASNRRYERLSSRDGQRAVLMDAPADKGEDVRPFVALANHLRSVGLSAPEILAQDTEHGFLLLEDLGDDLFARLMASDPSRQEPLYSAAIDVLLALRGSETPDLPAYDTAEMTELAALAFEKYLPATGKADHDVATAFRAVFPEILANHVTGPSVLVHRDFHAENLIWLPERKGAARVGLLDFQDAMTGHPAYDLVSLLQDARRDVPSEIQHGMIAQYLDRTGDDANGFLAAYAVLGVQRNLRILGVFARLCSDYGKPHYVDFVPRVWGYLMTGLTHPALAPVASLLRDTFPEPGTETLDRIRATCPTR